MRIAYTLSNLAEGLINYHIINAFRISLIKAHGMSAVHVFVVNLAFSCDYTFQVRIPLHWVDGDEEISCCNM